MKSKFLLKIGILMLFISTFVGCQTALITSVENHSERKNTPISSESKEFKIEGCTIPLPPEKTKYASNIENMKRVDEKSVEITNTTYNPIGEFVFTPDKSIFTQEPYDVLRRSENAQITFRLIRLQEMKVKVKIFGYFFVGQEVLSQEVVESAKPYNANYAGYFGFTCFDFTGDGNFEYINGQGKLAETIPDWATR